MTQQQEQVTEQNAAWFAKTFGRIVSNVGHALLGKDDVIRLALTTVFAGGHLLPGDAPGTGKTALARSIAATVQDTYSHIQFIPGLLPSDITGVTIYDQKTGKWNFHKGPIFASIVFADEINRTSSKTQSALSEIMKESRVTVDGVAHETGRPFIVIATQNPVGQIGTYPLPGAQLDRFLVKTSVGYPQSAAGVEILKGTASPDHSKDLPPVISTSAVDEMPRGAANNFVSEAVLGYVQNPAEATRTSKDVRVGVSTHGTISVVRAAHVCALSQGRNYVLPDDVKALVRVVWDHRLILDPDVEFAGATREAVVECVLEEVPAPTLRK